MLDTKLHILLSRFDIHELARFRKFIISPYHNEDQSLIKLYEYILPYYKKEETVLPAKELIWKQVNPGTRHDNLKYARLISDLMRKAESYLVAETFRKNQVSEKAIVLEVYNGMQLNKHFTEPYLAAYKKLQAKTHRDSDFFFYNFRLNAQRNAFLESKNERNTEKNLIETMNSLDQYYLINKLRYCAAMLHYNHFLSVQKDAALLPEILVYLKRTADIRLPVINVYYHILLMLIEPDEEMHFTGLKALLSRNIQLLEVATQKEAYDHALNYCVRRINRGSLHFQKEILALYKNALEHDILLDNGILSQWNYKNIVTIALRNQDYKWTNSFIETYKHKLVKSERTNAYTFNQARYYFAVKKYDQVLTLLQGVEYNDVFYLLDSKTTLMKTYYELGEFQPLQSLKESFRILLRRKKLISDQNRINYANFARFVMKLYRVDVKDKAKLRVLRKEIESTNNVADRSWIIEKLQQLDPPQ